MLSGQKSTICTVCAKFLEYYGEVFLCRSCVALHCPEVHASRTFKFSTGHVTCACCGLAPKQTDPHQMRCMWASFCIPCSLKQGKDSKRLTARENQLSFLRVFNPPPLSDGFEGDVSFIVDGVEVMQAHRFILGSKSPVFKKMMEVDMKEKITGKIHVDGISPAVVRAAVSCMYTAAMNFTDEVTPHEVLQFAHRYDISWLKDLCEDTLVQTISETTCLKLLSISYSYEAEQLKAVVKKFLTANPVVLSNVLDDMSDLIVTR